MSITIVGLGAGDGRLLTREAWEVLSEAAGVYLRTSRHPAVTDLPASVRCLSFDYLYETADDFAGVYAAITQKIIEAGRAGDVVYAVPGHPFVGESTVQKIVSAARNAEIPVRIVAGLSFVAPVLVALNAQALALDGMEGVQICDALDVAEQDYPRVNSDRPLLLGQVYNNLIAGELKLALTAVYPEEHPVTLVHAAGTEQEIVENVPLYALDRSRHIDHLTTLYVPPLPQPSDLSALAAAVATLRGPHGCPWDREQTPQSMRSGFLEEAYEVLAALDGEEPAALCEELGDMLLHIAMQAQMAAEMGAFRLSEVIAGIYAKIVRRHPHVWGDTQADSSADVVRSWEEIKAQEKKETRNRPASLLDNLPVALPALARAQEIQRRVRKVGFDWQAIAGVYAKLQEEIAELQTAHTAQEQAMELGDVLFVVVNLANWLGLDAETALREANLRFSGRFRTAEKLAAERNLTMAEMDAAALLDLWLEAKALTAV